MCQLHAIVDQRIKQGLTLVLPEVQDIAPCADGCQGCWCILIPEIIAYIAQNITNSTTIT